MENIYLLHGEEKGLIEQTKNKILEKYPDYNVTVYSEETPYERIMETMQEDSLFAEDRVYVMYNIPILKTTSNKSKSDSNGVWDNVYEAFLKYDKSNPIILIYDANLDQRVKKNKEFIAKAETHLLKKLSKDELIQWSEKYCRGKGHAFSQDGRRYFNELMDLWKDVPLTFLNTEFDRLFLFLKDKEPISRTLLARECSDFGSKNIFKFMDAFYEKDIAMMLEIVPFVMQRKEIDKFFAYLQSQLQLQLMVVECARVGMGPADIHTMLKESGMNVKLYPIKLAYQRGKYLRQKALKEFLIKIYEITIERRTGQIDESAFARACVCYCNNHKK